MVTLQLRQLDVPPGQRLLLHDVSWAEFEAILAELGEQRGSRIAYDNGLLEIMASYRNMSRTRKSSAIC